MRFTLGVIVAVLVLPRIAGAGGIVLEVKPSRTDYGASLSRHVEEPELPLDGGLMAIGWWFGDWQINATLMGHDVVTVNGGYDDNFMMAGVDVRHHRALRLGSTSRSAAASSTPGSTVSRTRRSRPTAAAASASGPASATGR